MQRNDASRGKGPLSNPLAFLYRRRNQTTTQDAAVEDMDDKQANDRHPSVDLLQVREENSADSAPILLAGKLHVERADLKVSFSLRRGDRLGITGGSGVGKTQVMRTLVGLEPWKGLLELDGDSPGRMKWPEWRRRVCWVSQDRPSLEGTPRDFFN